MYTLQQCTISPTSNTVHPICACLQRSCRGCPTMARFALIDIAIRGVKTGVSAGMGLEYAGRGTHHTRAKLLACRRGPKPQLPPGTRCACPDPGLVCPTHGWPALRPGAPRGHIWQHSTSIPCAQYPLAGRGALPDTSCNRLHTNIGPFVTKEPGLLGAQTEAQGMQKLHVQ